MTEDEKTELEMAIAREILELPGVGWWRRKSHLSNDIPCFELCEKGATTPDYPQWKARPGYDAGGGHEGYALPRVASDLNEALLVAARLKPVFFELVYQDQIWRATLRTKREHVIARVSGGSKEAPAEAVSRAALLMVAEMKKIHAPDGQPCSKCGYSDDNYGYHFYKDLKCVIEKGPCECGAWHQAEE